MAKFLFRLGKWSFIHKWVMILVWLILLGATAAGAGIMQKGFSNDFVVPGMPSAQAVRLFEESFPGEPNPVTTMGVTVVVKAQDGTTLESPENKKAVDDMIAYIKQNTPQLKDTTRMVSPVEMYPKMTKTIVNNSVKQGMSKEQAEANAKAVSVLSPDKKIGTFTFSVEGTNSADLDKRVHPSVMEALQVGRDAGLQAEAAGPAMENPIKVTGTSEAIGLLVAFLVLAFTFGSLAAAGLPLITAVIGVAIGVLGVVWLTAFQDVNSVTPTMAVMLGLAVGIDYALFIVSRYRSELANGLDRPTAMGVAAGTAGSAVIFAGMTVIIALVALVIADIPFLTLMGYTAAFTVFVAVLVALTLVPAVLGLLGDKAFAGKVPLIAGNRWKKHRRILRKNKTMGRRWVERVHRTPAFFLVGVTVVLLAMSWPVTHLAMSLPSDQTAEYGTTQRNSVQLLDEAFGPGRNSQILIVANGQDVDPNAPALSPLIDAIAKDGVTREEAAPKAAFAYVISQMSNNVGVENVQFAGLRDDGKAAQLALTPTTGPLDKETTETIKALRDQQAQIQSATGLRLGITGLTPVKIDVTQKLAQAMPLYLSVVVGLAIVLLLMVFRSVMVPITAAAGFLLSVGGAFGMTVLFWQDGFGGFVPTPGPIIAFMPIFLIGVTFGLAMDYQVFLVSRMREHFTHSGGKPSGMTKYNAAEESIIQGFSEGARVVTAAALIMITVFVAFIGQPLPFIKIFGFALGLGILFDAFLIRMTLIPAAMFLLGRSIWWMPKWLDKILPNLDVEGSKLQEHIQYPDRGHLRKEAIKANNVDESNNMDGAQI